jgi:putative ABC transport system permease protein
MSASNEHDLPRPARIGLTEFVRLAGDGLAARRLRACLSALGISIGIAALVAVVGLSASSQRDVDRQLGRYADLLSVGSGQSLTGNAVPLPDTARSMIGRIPPIYNSASIGILLDSTVRRTSLVAPTSTGGIAVVAADPALANALDATVVHGTFLNPATATYPAVVLGASAARFLGVVDASPGVQVDIDGNLFAVVGILAPVEIAPEIDQTALIGFPIAESLLGFDGAASRIYVRAAIDQVLAVRGVLARTANPEQPEAVVVSRASDLLAARLTARSTLSALSIGLGIVALLIGGIGIANVMVIAVLERRNEIGVRRALGATRAQIAVQFLVEAAVLAALGGIAGVSLGSAAVAITAHVHRWPAAVPAFVVWGGGVVAVAIGGLAGLYPAIRAGSIPPADALRSA